MDIETKKALQQLLIDIDMASVFADDPGVAMFARNMVRKVKEILAAHSLAGYDVYCSQDAPTFATWEWVARVKDDIYLFGLDAITHTFEGIPFSEIDGEDTRIFEHIPERHPETGDIIRLDDECETRELRRYRILPAGSPAPTEGGE